MFAMCPICSISLCASLKNCKSDLYSPALEEHYDMCMLLLMHAPSVLVKATEPGTSAQLKAFEKFHGTFRIAQVRPNDALSSSLVMIIDSLTVERAAQRHNVDRLSQLSGIMVGHSIAQIPTSVSGLF